MVIREVVDGQSGLPCPESTKSYWHKEPSEKLLGYKSTAELPETADIVIVGSGITGAFAAHFLKNGEAANKQVVMLEAREACWGATGRNGGHCQPIVYASEPDVAAFELETFEFLLDFVHTHQVPCDWRSLTGVHTFLTEDVYDLASVVIEALKKKHPSLARKVELVSPGRESESGYTLSSLRVPGAVGAVVQSSAASLWPYKLVCHVLEMLISRFPAPSFNLQTLTPVTGFSRWDRDRDGAYPWALTTPRGRIAAAQVLLATNGYTSRLLPSFTDMIVPVRGQIGALLPPTEPAADLAHSYVFIGNYTGERGEAVTRNEYLVQRPLPSGELILGGGRHIAKNLAVGEWRDDVVEERVARYLRQELTPVLDLRLGTPGAGDTEEKEELQATYEWTGVMAYSRDRNPWVGAVPASAGGGEGLYVCAGYTGHGMPAAALCAREVVAMMVGGSGLSSGKQGDMPKSFVVSEERIKKAREEWDEMVVEEGKGLAAQLARLRAAMT